MSLSARLLELESALLHRQGQWPEAVQVARSYLQSYGDQQKAAGMRIEPAVSPPSSRGVRPAATAAAAPPEDPPGDTSARHGLSVWP